VERPSGRLAHTVNSLADLHLSAESLDSILGHIGNLGVHALEGWDACATSLVEGDRVATFGATDDRVCPIDSYQYDSGQGPCVTALQGESQYFNGENFAPEWREFGEAAARAGIYSVVSFPLKLDDQVIGALNFYSTERDALRSGQREEGLLFASQAAVTLSNAREFFAKKQQVEQLQDGLGTRTIIGQATGLLMAHEGLTSEEAFQKLVNASQQANIKLRDIAQRYVTAWEEKARGPSAAS
jgi:GAF domain-containing protein